MNLYILSILVNNHPGVLTRVTGLFTRRGYNLKELTVGETEDPRYSRITIVTDVSDSGDETLRQIRMQLSKLHDVKTARVLPYEKRVGRELLLMKLEHSDGAEAALLNENCTILDQTDGCIILEMTGDAAAVNAFIGRMQAYGVREICRTGLAALEKGGECLAGGGEPRC